jgi:small ligand-binding sensory domain FIST
MPASCSFSLVTQQPDEVARVVSRALAQLGAPAGGAAVFLGGAIGRSVIDVGRAVAAASGKTPMIVAAGAGVLTDKGEHDQLSAVSGIAWRGKPSAPFVLDVDPSEGSLTDRVLTESSKALGGRAGAVALFATRELVSPTELYGLDRAGLGTIIFGGGCLGRPGAAAIVDGKSLPGDVVGLAIRGPANPIVRASPACRLLGELEPVTQAEGALVLRVGERSALEALSTVAPHAPRGQVVVLAVEVPGNQERRSQLMIRGIRGVHEPRAGLVVSEDVFVGTRVAFAVVDARAARQDLEASLREIARETRGGVPLFGMYMDCAGRGGALYGEKDVDVQMIRDRWPGLPFAGVKSAFEIGPGRSGMTAHLYSGVFALFHAPS